MLRLLATPRRVRFFLRGGVRSSVLLRLGLRQSNLRIACARPDMSSLPGLHVRAKVAPAYEAHRTHVYLMNCCKQPWCRLSKAVNGLQVENSKGEVTKIAAAVDAHLPVVKEAIARGCDLLLVHHGCFGATSCRSRARPFKSCAPAWRTILPSMRASAVGWASGIGQLDPAWKGAGARCGMGALLSLQGI